MKRIVYFLYSLVCYAVFFVSFLYAVGFINNMVVPKSIDSGTEGALGSAMTINAILLSIFALQHTVMARPAFKRLWTRLVPEPIERSTFVLAASVILLHVFGLWSPITDVAWHVDNTIAAGMLTALSFAGFGIVLYGSFLINHFDLFGLRQAYLYFQGKEYTPVPFTARSLYKVVRNPLMFGFLIAFWASPHMTYGHLFFAVGTTVYILVGIYIEERDIEDLLGEEYREYRRDTAMLIPGLKGVYEPAPRQEESAPTE